MTAEEFKKETRLTRGRLTNLDKELNLIYYEGIEELQLLCYKNKQMGIVNIAELTYLPISGQEQWYEWLSEKGFKATKNEMELKLSLIKINSDEEGE
jgi:hypothetical protein